MEGLPASSQAIASRFLCSKLKPPSSNEPTRSVWMQRNRQKNQKAQSAYSYVRICLIDCSPGYLLAPLFPIHGLHISSWLRHCQLPDC
jgi:hypothetical protein